MRGGSPAPYRGLLPDQEVDQQEELLAFQVGLLAVLQGLQQPEMMTTLLNTSCDRGRWWEEGGCTSSSCHINDSILSW